MPRERTSFKRLKRWVMSEEGLQTISQMAADNMTRKEIAKELGISKQKLDLWVAEDDRDGDGALGDALERSDRFLNYKVEAALYQAALGYTSRTTEITAKLRKDSQGVLRLRATEKLTIEEQQAPNVGAARYILNNRNPDKWKDKRVDEVDIDYKPEININVVRAQDNTETIESSAFDETEEDKLFAQELAEEQAAFDEWTEFDS